MALGRPLRCRDHRSRIFFAASPDTRRVGGHHSRVAFRRNLRRSILPHRRSSYCFLCVDVAPSVVLDGGDDFDHRDHFYQLYRFSIPYCSLSLTSSTPRAYTHPNRFCTCSSPLLLIRRFSPAAPSAPPLDSSPLRSITTISGAASANATTRIRRLPRPQISRILKQNPCPSSNSPTSNGDSPSRS